jgi:hypothetical protein
MRKAGHKPDTRGVPIERFFERCPPKCRPKYHRIIRENFDVTTVEEFAAAAQTGSGLSAAHGFTGRMIFIAIRIVFREGFDITITPTKEDKASMEAFLTGD